MPFVPGTVRGKKWMPPPRPEPATSSKDDEKVELDIEGMEGDVEVALNAASTDEIVDLAGILGLHSMMNQVCIEYFCLLLRIWILVFWEQCNCISSLIARARLYHEK